MTTTVTIPTLTTARLTLRAPEARDFEAYAAYRASARTEHVGGPQTRDAAWGQFCALIGQWHLRGYGRWLVADRETDAPLGVVGLFYPEGWPEPEIGWTVFADAEGKGIAHEAALASRTYAYDTLGWTTVISMVSLANTRSVALARRLGCHHESIFDSEAYGPMDVWRHPGPEEVTP